MLAVIKIIKSDNPQAWYAKEIGSQFYASLWDHHSINNQKIWYVSDCGWLWPDDCEVLYEVQE